MAGYKTELKLATFCFKLWAVEDSNLWPQIRQICALPTELTAHNWDVRMVGFGPTVSAL